ncbi:Ig-like domain-containing protein [Oceanisphaera arctica]|uniref:Alpha-galactosidase NEW3 domain-containing protein n=1 Tax=Oceanisphaera arctica TaxID=641510 RepID=A0A2P5TPB5_9GAMM|nr:Ig-like domain-containing protein [Oceanisphaera arctica]PPL17525.1 hypothetical protein UN63_04345 [Oceanisphaera arctica]GHA16540.1 hypothetical protein GCM10007082_16650 [Oceanisphaera arctica]
MRLSRPAIASLLAAGGITAALSMSLPAFAGPEHQDHSVAETSAAAAQDARQQAEQQTGALLAQYRYWQAAANSADKSRALLTLTELADARGTMMAELAAADPRAVLDTAISEQQRQGMPADIRAMLEQRFELEGELEARYEDDADGGHRLLHRLKTADGEEVTLLATDNQAELPHGSRVKAKGWLLPKAEGVVDETGVVNGGLQLLQIGGDGTATGSSVMSSSGPSLGEQKTLVMLVNFTDKAEQPYTREEASQLIFGQVDAYYQENTYRRSWLTGEVAGWFTIPLSSQVCDVQTLAAQAQDEAVEAGVELSQYNRYIYVFPNNSCGFSGTATVGGTPSQAWINQSLTLTTMAHEFGHNLGTVHAHSLVCNDGTSVGAGGGAVGATPWPNCTNLEYGDGLDVMGWAASGHFNAMQKQRLGWLDDEQVLTVTDSGQYSLSPVAAQQAGVKALKILKNINENGRKTWYYLEYRQPIGFDGSIAAADSMMDTENVTNGVTVRVHYEGGASNGVYLLDMTPETNGDLYTRDPALEAGSTFVDPDGLLEFTPIRVDGTEAVVDIRLFDSPCVSQPGVVEAISASQQGAPGETLSYQLRVTNPNGVDCGSLDIALDVQGPTGWSVQQADSLLSLAPGETVTTSLAVTSAADAASGDHGIIVSAWSGEAEASTQLVYRVVADSLPPVAVDDDAQMDSKQPIVIYVLNNDWDPAEAPLRVSGVTQGAKGSVVINGDGSLSYTPARNFKNGDSFDYQITNGSHSAQARVRISLTGTGGTGGGPGKGKK